MVFKACDNFDAVVLSSSLCGCKPQFISESRHESFGKVSDDRLTQGSEIPSILCVMHECIKTRQSLKVSRLKRKVELFSVMQLSYWKTASDGTYCSPSVPQLQHYRLGFWQVRTNKRPHQKTKPCALSMKLQNRILASKAFHRQALTAVYRLRAVHELGLARRSTLSVPMRWYMDPYYKAMVAPQDLGLQDGHPSGWA